jgi:predicted DNA binding CopG/RHH family protein
MPPTAKKDDAGDERDDAEDEFSRLSSELGDKALKQVEAELARAEEDQARRRKFPKEAFAKGRTKPIAVRFDEFTLKRLRALAARRNTGYQTLLKEFVVERLYEEEKREGIIE